MVSTSDGESSKATDSEATGALVETLSNQGSNAPDTTRNQQADHDANEIHRPPCGLFTLSPEIRAMIFGFICTDDSIVSLPGPLPSDIAALMLASKAPNWRAEVLEALWQNWSIEWHGSLESRTWQRFKKTVIPLIRRLTITFEMTSGTWFDFESPIRQTLAWMWQRSKRGNQARYTWCLEQLHLRGLRHSGSSVLLDKRISLIDFLQRDCLFSDVSRLHAREAQIVWDHSECRNESSWIPPLGVWIRLDWII